jgi:transcriptional regulator with XRE-family HTH domain
VKIKETKKGFGEKIRAVREKKGITLKELSGRIGLSESLVSQIERNRISPSLDTLLALTDALDIDLEWLFKDRKRDKTVSIVRPRDRRKTVLKKTVFYHLSSMSDASRQHGIEAYLLEIQPGGEKGEAGYGHPGSELGLILEGRGRLSYGTGQYDLETGDSVSFASDIPHTLTNTGKNALKAIWVITPPKGWSERE